MHTEPSRSIKLFESKQIRTEWDETKQKWYFAIIDVIEILTESHNPRRYWSDLKRKLNSEGFSQLYEIIVQLKMISSDGKKYFTDCTDAKGLLSIIQCNMDCVKGIMLKNCNI